MCVFGSFSGRHLSTVYGRFFAGVFSLELCRIPMEMGAYLLFLSKRLSRKNDAEFHPLGPHKNKRCLRDTVDFLLVGTCMCAGIRLFLMQYFQYSDEAIFQEFLHCVPERARNFLEAEALVLGLPGE